ncbi:hypothetical protein H312_01080 [Anncaliia algerae PRA339]|uniref:Uncharacterized protein n=1 Tax=Anncaliia algerae PRA339 TaxID=1288291 RepID=A0A059F329_9MICR|nr:hypothetical protein H312_01080 [Anncaliia algerae PRA339]
MDNSKSEKLVQLVCGIKNKLEKIIKLNEYLVEFNFRIETLLISLDEVSIHIEPSTQKIEEVEVKEESIITLQSDASIKEISLDELLIKIENVIKAPASYKQCIEKIVRFIYKGNGASHDELIKKCGVSKYRCIEVINLLGKSSPQFLHKNTDKGIFYYLNLKIK